MISIDKLNDYSNYCLSCTNGLCKVGCPLHNDISGFIKLIKDNKYEEAYYLLCETTVLSSICGRICPHNDQCQSKCIRGKIGNPVNIGILESFVGDCAIDNKISIPKINNNRDKKVLVIGSGPSSLTCAAYLARYGIRVTIYEKYNKLGGILNHSVPNFRLDKKVLQNSINKILELGIDVKYNMELNKDFYINDVIDKYDAIYIGIGANISNKLSIDGEQLEGVYGGNELLEYNNHPDYTNKIVAIIGGGNVAIDVSRIVKRMGAKKVYIIYRRNEEDMPASKEEIKEAKDEGINFIFKTNILKIIGNKKVEKIECIKTNLINKDNLIVPINIDNSNYNLDVDYVIESIGSHSDYNIINSLGLELNNNKTIKIDSDGKTSNEKIYSGGDIAGIKSTVAFAASSGYRSAKAINKYLGGKNE